MKGHRACPVSAEGRARVPKSPRGPVGGEGTLTDLPGHSAPGAEALSPGWGLSLGEGFQGEWSGRGLLAGGRGACKGLIR